MAKPIVGMVKGARIKEGDPEKNPFGLMQIIVECRNDEDNLLAYSRIRGAEVVLDALQREIWEQEIERA